MYREQIKHKRVSKKELQMNEILKLFGSGIDNVIDSVGNTLDKLITSDEERKILQNELEEIRLNAKLSATDKSIALEKEITSRWKIDKDNVITRNIRPLVVFWSYFLFTLVLLFDGNIGQFHINSAYIPMLQTILVTVTIAYFGSRGIEKTSKIVKEKPMDMF